MGGYTGGERGDKHTILELEREYGILLRSPDASPDASITGHIDFLQVRNRAVHVLDYKPDARTNRPIAQLTIYALALTRLIPARISADATVFVPQASHQPRSWSGSMSVV